MLSDNIKTLRKNRGFTQEDLASRLHVTRQTISKWEKGYSVPDAAMLSRMAEELEVPVTELLGAPSAASDPEPIVEQLSRLNEQLAVRNRRAARIWKIVGIALAVLVLLYIAVAAAGIVLFRAEGPQVGAGSVTWLCTLDGETYTCGVEYTKQYQILSGFTEADSALADRVREAGVDPTAYGDAKQARTVLYDWFEGQGGTVEVLRQEGLSLDG